MARAHESSFRPGHLVVQQEDWGESVMLLSSGLAKVSCTSLEGEEIILSVLGVGDLVGDMALLDGKPRSADVVALTALSLWKIPGPDFRAVLDVSPRLALAMAQLQSQRLRDLNRRFSVQRSDATTRVLDALLYLALKASDGQDPLALIPAVPQRDIAALAGLSRETSSRTMSKLRSRGSVMEESGGLRLTSREPLERRALL
ncbi:Crp/Fnr family transcriptional regulator [Synechococcus sp. RSCCF101]|uniref:Crp/Fnr family transcriptional regulator n=1 Tax=Synechococcus sp. RSCCF101 TaxID=2511069 RepID=UPI001CD9E526|nr:Crp/Fnr family transcriptional regulator [Synechococcus sp. RSCCF101]